MKAWVLGLGALLAVSTLLGCKDDCADAVAAAEKFLGDPQNLTCESNEDCTVVSTGCAPVADAFCGQSPLSKRAAASAAWSQIQKDLQSCGTSCAICTAALTPGCSAGTCGKPK